MKWNERLTVARKARGFYKVDVANAVGVAGPTVTNWENGRTESIGGDNLLKVCEFLGITSEWLLYGKGDSPSGSSTAPASNQNNDPSSLALIHVNEEELRLLTRYRKTDDFGQQSIMLMASTVKPSKE